MCPVPAGLAESGFVRVTLLEGKLMRDAMDRTSCCPLIKEMGKAIELASICGLGRSVPVPLTTAFNYFEADVNKHLSGNGGQSTSNESMPDSDFVAGLFVRDDDEAILQSRHRRTTRPAWIPRLQSDYDKNVTLQIDGESVTVPMAEPLKDANGNIVVDLEGEPRRVTRRSMTPPRKLYVEHIGDEKKIPIPILCHLPHMTPVAVCRLCMVQI